MLHEDLSQADEAIKEQSGRMVFRPQKKFLSNNKYCRIQYEKKKEEK